MPLAPAGRGALAAASHPRVREIERVRRLVRLLDHRMLDPLLGFVLPGAGDVIGSVLGLYIIGIAVRRRSSPILIARMLMNLAIDGVIGVVPLIGDVADLAFKANQKNLALLVDREVTGKASARDWIAVGGALIAFVAVAALAIYAAIAALRAIV